MQLRIGRPSIVVTGLLVIGLAVLGPPSAAAHLVEVTTSLALDEAQDKEQLKDALKTEVDRVLATAIAFKPTMVALTDARQVGQRLMLRLLIADEDGERFIEELERDGDEGGAPRQIRF
jgi:hypothetical protein